MKSVVLVRERKLETKADSKIYVYHARGPCSGRTADSEHDFLAPGNRFSYTNVAYNNIALACELERCT